MTNFNTGYIPNTDFTYEEFASLLGSFYASLRPLQESRRYEDKMAFDRARKILEGFSERYNVPFLMIEGEAPVMSNRSMLDMTGSFWRDFGVGAEPETVDSKERIELGKLILGVYSRLEIADVEYKAVGEVLVPKFVRWKGEKAQKTLVEVLRE